MHISALCPFCQSGYQVQATLRGKLVRCPNAACRKVFSVPGEESPPQTISASRPSVPPDHNQRSGSVGDMVPILPAEEAAVPASGGSPAEADWWHSAPPVREAPKPSDSAPSSSPASETWWQEAPPPVRSPQTPPAAEAPPPRSRPERRPRKPVESTKPTTPPTAAAQETQQMWAIPIVEPEDQPREVPPGEWEPPPVRREAAGDENAPQVEEAAPESERHQPRVSKRLALILSACFLLLLIVGGGVGGVWLWRAWYQNEETLAKKAHADYKLPSYRNASDEFDFLAKKFPESAHAEEYRFLAEWSAVCSLVSDPDSDLAASITRLDQFLKEHKNNPLLQQNGAEAGRQLLKLTAKFAARNANPTDENPLKDADRIEEMRGIVVSLGPDALSKDETGVIDTELGKVRRAVELALKRRSVLAQIAKGKKETWMEAIKRVRVLLARMERELPGIGDDPETQALLAKLYQEHLASVKFHPRQEDIPQPQPRPEDEGDTLVFAPLLPTAAPGSAPKNDPIVLALVRGVLYALKQSNGEVKWASRVGVDTTVLPLRVPPSPASPELLLVLSADTQTLSALNVEGDLQWEYPVGQRVLGRPILIDHRAYLAAYDGWVHEIELSRGELLGRWYLGQRLTRGGAREGDTHRIYFPADDSCVYVLDVKERRCLNILDEGHRSGSLRSELVVIPPIGDSAPGYLIENEVNGLDAMRLRAFALPLQGRHADPLPLKPPAELPGWTWFEPYQDAEKLAVLSDAGILGLFGIKQPGNRDPALFPLLQQGSLDLSPFLLNPERELPRERGRAQVVYMQGDDLWVLAYGRLQQVHLGWKAASGPQATAGWPTPLTLGSPLHAPQRFDERKNEEAERTLGPSIFCLVTQALEQQTCLATAVDEQGKIRWQRQLGLVCQGEPLALTPPGGGPALLLTLDQGGGLFVLDPQKPKKPRSLAAALDENPQVPPRLLLGSDGRSAYEVAAPGTGRSLVIRRIEWAEGERELLVKESSVACVSTADKSTLIPAGSPVVAGTQLFIPMTDGTLRRLSLDQPVMLQSGPTWRDDLASLSAPCHTLALGGDRFLLTDGSAGLRVYEWPAEVNKNYQLLPKGREELPRLEYPVAAPPVLLPANGGLPRIAVADTSGMLHLFIVASDGALQTGLSWDLKGKITIGPFVHTQPDGSLRLGCVVDQHRLVWLDPDKQEPLWNYPSEKAPLIAPPTRIEDLLVVALQSGHYIGLDPNTGQPKGGGYTLRTSAAPASSPMPFGPGRMFTPLSDGTALLLSLDRLREPAKK